MKYRADIDGLRAIAVVLVVVFHAFAPLFRGGFVGVDIFFVISGFLITSIIVRDLAAGQFSYLDFYLRRIRRLFPALLVVLCSVFIAGWFLLLPDEFSAAGWQIFSGAFFFSNLSLLTEISYFNAGAVSRVFLHLWSLGVEAQLYVLCSVFLVFLHRNRLNRVTFISAISLLSLLAALLLFPDRSRVQFYLPVTRIWEFFAGGLLAFSMGWRTERGVALRDMIDRGAKSLLFSDKRAPDGQTFSSMLGIIGIALICMGPFVSRDVPAYPDIRVLLSVLGVVLVIWAGPHSLVNRRFLSCATMVFLGRISYPLYLWHWPILVIMRLLEGGRLPVWHSVLAVIMALVLSVLTYWLVEKPVFKIQDKKKIATLLVIVMAAVGAVGLFTRLNSGFDGRSGIASGHSGFASCSGQYLFRNVCQQGNGDAPKKILMFGDSHLYQLTQAVIDQFGADYAIDIVYEGSCFFGNDLNIPGPGSDQRLCNRRRNFVRRLDIESYDFVITAQRWHGYGLTSIGEYVDALTDRVALLKAIDPKKVIIAGSVPDIDYNCQMAQIRRFGRGAECKTFKDTIKAGHLFEAASRFFPEYQFIFPARVACPGPVCQLVNGDGEYMYIDKNHISLEAAKRIVQPLQRIIN